MKIKPYLPKFNEHLTRFRHSLAYIDALPQLTLLGFLIGTITGCFIVLFRFVVDSPLAFFLDGKPDSFELLSVNDRTLLIFGGVFALGILIHFADKKYRDVSVSHVLDRLHNYQGKLPAVNWILQFSGAAVALISGQSVGREGPAVHLGAGIASMFGRWLKLPNNSMHTLIACGVAAAIAASFDTPMAGVIFAMEVIIMEYTIIGFVPVIMASVMGTMISQAAFGQSGLILTASSDINSLLELPYMVAVGLVISICAATYIKLNIVVLRFQTYPILPRLLAAGALTAMVASQVPEIMGLGYDTVNQAMTGELLLGALVIIAIAKLCVTPVVIALGIPGGVIGPLLVIGACVGGAMEILISTLFPQLDTSIGIYVILGMTGMMAAALNAPLAALVAVLELSYNPNMIFPAMLVIVVACVSTRQFFKLNSIFIEQLKYTGRTIDFGPAKQALRRAGVRSIMNTRFANGTVKVSLSEAQRLLEKGPLWVVYEEDGGKHAILAADLAKAVETKKQIAFEQELAASEDENSTAEATTVEDIDLSDIAGRRINLAPIHESANLLEALKAIKAKNTEGLFISKPFSPLSGDVLGIVTLAAIENYYQPKEFKNAVG